MKFRFTLLIVGLLFLNTLKAQTKTDTIKYWKTGGMSALNMSQISLTNWAAGGQNSESGAAMLSLFANYKKDKTSLDNTLDIAYGMTKLGDASPTKSDDKIELTSKYGHAASANWYYSGLFSFKTQFAPGYSSPTSSVIISDFMAPAFLQLSLGMDYKLEKSNFDLLLSPIAGKLTIVNNQQLADQGAYGVDKAVYDPITNVKTKDGKESLSEFGGFLKTTYKFNIMENVTFQTKLELFSNYIKNPQNIVVNWETLTTMKINKYLAATFSTVLLYDDKTIPRIQFKEVFGLGFSYKF